MDKTNFLKYLKEQVSHFQNQYRVSTGAAFGMWYATDCIALEEDEAFEAISYDGGNDKDIDLFSIDHPNERILIGQLKYKELGNYKGKKTELLGLIHTTDWLKDPEALRRDGRDDLAEAAEDYLNAVDEGYSVEYMYVYTGPSNKDVNDAAKQFNLADSGSVPSKTCRVVSFESLVSEHLERVDQTTRISNVSLKLIPGSWIEISGSFGKSLVTTLKGTQLKELHSTHGDRLFDRNVRLFLGARKGGINAGLRDTLSSTSDRKNFWAYNNGITFVCDTYQITKDGELTLHNFSIVNGCQTTVSLSNANATAAKNAEVLTRFIAAQENIIDPIIRFNNSQNPIKIWDLASQDRLQKRIKKDLAALPTPFLYILRKGETRKLTAAQRKQFKKGGKQNHIQHDLNAQYLAAFKGLPAIAYKDKGKIFASHYNEVYPQQIKAEEILLVWKSGTIAAQLVKEALKEAAEDEDLGRVSVLKRGAKFFVLGVMAVLMHSRNGSTFLNKLRSEVAISMNTERRLKNYATVAIEWYLEIVGDLVDSGTEITTIVRSQDHWIKISQKVKSKWKVFKLAKKVVDETLPKL